MSESVCEVPTTFRSAVVLDSLITSEGRTAFNLLESITVRELLLQERVALLQTGYESVLEVRTALSVRVLPAQKFCATYVFKTGFLEIIMTALSAEFAL